MITDQTILDDDFEDEILKTLQAFNLISSWNKTKYCLKSLLIKQLNDSAYIFFRSSRGVSDYKISKIGASYLYDVPLYKRGNLSSFKGKRVRIVCVETGSNFWRGYCAGVVYDTPKDKIISSITKRAYKYTFPPYIQKHKIIYKSLRYIIFQADKSVRILSKHSPKGYINSDGWDSILVDGKIGIPIATIRHNANGSVEGKHLYGSTEVFKSAREAIDRLSRRAPWMYSR